MEINFENCSDYSGWLKKKASKIMVGWQKKFFRIIKGKVILYSDKEDDNNPKGQIMIASISRAEPIEEDKFQFSLGDKVFHLKASDTKSRDEWVNVINFLIDAKPKIPTSPSKRDKKEDSSSTRISELDKGTLDLIRNSGFSTGSDFQLNEKLLTAKGIDRMINLNNPDIRNRMYCGFLFKKHKTHDYFQKRWFFIFSTRPLRDELYEKDDVSLDMKKYNKDWLKFDQLFYFKYEKDKEASGPIDGLELGLSHKIESIDKNGKYYLILDVEDRIFEYYSEIKGDRDLWFEVLKNSRRTAKEIKASVKGHPRNVQKLSNLLDESPTKLEDELGKEKLKIVGDYKEIADFDTLMFILKDLRKEISCTIDGCISTSPPKTELLNIFAENFLGTYLNIVQTYWTSHYDTMDGGNMIKLASSLFKFEEKLKKLRVNEPNLSKNGKELVKIYMKKTYKNITDVIENILKSEREVKAIKSDNGECMTNGPNDLFDILSKSFDLIAEEKNKYIHSKMLNMFYECIIQYLIGVDCITSNNNIIVDRDFLIAIANNSVLVNILLSSLIDNFREADVLSEDEINEEIRTKEIMSSLNLMSQNAVSRFVSELSKRLASVFNCNFLDLDLHKVLFITNEIYSPLNPLMNGMIKKKAWEEILKETVFLYLKLLLVTAHKKVKKVEDLTSKLEYDKGLLTETYLNFVGENLTKANVKIIDDIIDFLQISSYMIPSSCHTLREYLGPGFNIKFVKALVNLRCDFEKEEKKEAINMCKEVLDNFVDKNKGKKSGFFDKMQQEIKLDNEESEMGLEGEEDDFISEEERKKEESTKVLDLEDFLNNEDDEEEENEEKEEAMQDINEKEQEQISDVVYEGKMKKKSYSVWQERYFQLKNGFLYWFKDKHSMTVQNKISIKNTMKVESHKDCKFLMVVEDKADKKHGGRVYKFACHTEEEKEKWINALTSEMKRLRGETEKKDDIILSMKIKKKVIVDFYHLSDVGKERAVIKERIVNSINNERFFPPKESEDKNKSQKGARKDKKGGINGDTEKEQQMQQFEIAYDDPKSKSSSTSIFNCFKGCWKKFISIFKGSNDVDAKEHLNPNN